MSLPRGVKSLSAALHWVEGPVCPLCESFLEASSRKDAAHAKHSAQHFIKGSSIRPHQPGSCVLWQSPFTTWQNPDMDPNLPTSETCVIGTYLRRVPSVVGHCLLSYVSSSTLLVLPCCYSSPEWLLVPRKMHSLSMQLGKEPGNLNWSGGGSRDHLLKDPTYGPPEEIKAG